MTRAKFVGSGVKRLWLWPRSLLEPSLLVFWTAAVTVTVCLARVQTYSVYTPIPVPSGFYHHPELGTFSPIPPMPMGSGPGLRPEVAMGFGGQVPSTSPRPSPSVLSTTSFFVPAPGPVTQFSHAPEPPRPVRMPGPGPGGPVPLAHHMRYHRPGQVLVPHARAPHARPRQPPPPHARPPPQPRPSRLQVYRHSRKHHSMDTPVTKTNWVPVHGSSGSASAYSTSTLSPGPGSAYSSSPVSYISFDQYPSTSTSTSVSSSVSTSISKAPMPMPLAPESGTGKGSSRRKTTKATTTTTAPEITSKSPKTRTTIAPMPVPAAAVVEDAGAGSGAEFGNVNENGTGKRRRKGKRRTTTTTSTTTTTPPPARIKETPEFQVPNPIYDYDGDYDADYANNVLKRSPWSTTTEQSSSSSSSRRPTLLQRIELSDVTRIRANAAAKAASAKNKAIAKSTKSKSQQLWADRHTTTETQAPSGRERDDDEIKKVISTELRKTHLSTVTATEAVRQGEATERSTVAAPIWRVTRVQTSMNYSDSMPDGRGGVNELTVLPYDGDSHFESMYADRPTVNYVDLVTGESFNPFANSTPPITQDLYNSDGKKERKQIQHQLLLSDDADLRQGSKLPENKTVDVDDTLSYLPREVPVEPDFKKTRLRLKKKHPLLNQDSIITAEQSVTKNGLEISTNGEDGDGQGGDGGGGKRNPTTPMSTGPSAGNSAWAWDTDTRSTTTLRPYTTSRIILTTRRPSTSLSAYTTEILNSWNSPTRTSTYATTTVAQRPAPTSTPTTMQVTTRRNPATTPAFTTSTPATTTRRSSTSSPTTTRATSTTTRATTPASTSTSTAATQPQQQPPSDNGLLDLFTLLGQTNTNANDGSTTQANIFGFGQQQQQAQDLQSQLSLLESLLQGTQNLFGVSASPSTTTTTTSTTTTTTERQPPSTSDPAATLSDSEIKSFLNILGVSTSAVPAPNSHSNGNPNNIQAVLEQQAPTPTLSTQFVAPSPAVPAARPAPAHTQTTAVPSLSAALSNMLAVLSNPFAPVTTTAVPPAPIQDNSLNNAALLAALLSPQNAKANGNANGNSGQGDSLLTQLLQLGNALDPSTSNTATRQVEATTPSSTTTTTTQGALVTRVPSLFDFSSLLGGGNAGNGGGNLFGNAGAGGGNSNGNWLNSLFSQPAATTSTTTSNPLAALLDLNRLLFPNGNNNGVRNNGLGGLGGFGGFGNLFGAQPATTTMNPFASLFNFNSLLTPSAAAATRAPATTPASFVQLAAANNQIEFHIPTTKRPSHPGPYVWLDVNTFFGGGAGPNDGLRPRIGSRDPFIRV